MKRGRIIIRLVIFMLCFAIFSSMTCFASNAENAYIVWSESILINEVPIFSDAGVDSRGEHPGKFGSQFPRMLICSNGDWLVAYTMG